METSQIRTRLYRKHLLRGTPDRSDPLLDVFERSCLTIFEDAAFTDSELAENAMYLAEPDSTDNPVSWTQITYVLPEMVRTNQTCNIPLDRRSRCWMDAGMFLAMAGVLILPGGAASGSILLVCSIACLIYGRSGWCSPTLSKRELWFLGCMALYPVVVVFNVSVFVDPVTWHYFDGPSRFLFALPIYLAIRMSYATPDALVRGAIIGSACAGLLSGYQFIVLGDLRPGGFVNPVSFSSIALLLVCLALVPTPLPRTWRWLRASGVVLGAAAVLLANTRGTFVAIPFLVWMMGGWFWSSRSRLRKWRVLAPVAIVGMLLIIPYSQQRIVDVTFSELSNLGKPNPSSPSMYNRLERQKAAWILFEKYPWFGVGFGQYWSEVQRLHSQGLVQDIEIYGYHAHNNFLHLAAEMGIAGVLVYLLHLICIFQIGHHCCRRRSDSIGVMLKIFSVGQGIYSLTDAQFSINITCTFFAMTAAILAALAFNEHDSERSTAAPQNSHEGSTPSP